MPGDLTAIQQSFVRRYMHGDERIVGVRMCRDSDGWYLDVQLDSEHVGTLNLPARHEGVRVIARAGQRAILAYAAA